jgi:hypothetical protein
MATPGSRRCERSEAIHLSSQLHGLLAMTARYDSTFSRRDAPELCVNDPPNEGRGATPRGERGMPGARCTRSRVRSGRKHTR